MNPMCRFVVHTYYRLPSPSPSLLSARHLQLQAHLSLPFTSNHASQVNLLGTALLSLILLEPLKRTAEHLGSPSRLTVVASEVHFWTPFNEARAPSILQRLDEEDSFNKQNLIERYNTSKLLGVLWTRELASKVDRKSVIVNCLNPWIVASSLHRLTYGRTSSVSQTVPDTVPGFEMLDTVTQRKQ